MHAHPMGCPRDTAPPFTLTFAGSMSNILMLASTTTLKASLISHMAMSSFCRPAASRAWQQHTAATHSSNTQPRRQFTGKEEGEKKSRQQTQAGILSFEIAPQRSSVKMVLQQDEGPTDKFCSFLHLVTHINKFSPKSHFFFPLGH